MDACIIQRSKKEWWIFENHILCYYFQRHDTEWNPFHGPVVCMRAVNAASIHGDNRQFANHVFRGGHSSSGRKSKVLIMRFRAM